MKMTFIITVFLALFTGLAIGQSFNAHARLPINFIIQGQNRDIDKRKIEQEVLTPLFGKIFNGEIKSETGERYWVRATPEINSRNEVEVHLYYYTY